MKYNKDKVFHVHIYIGIALNRTGKILSGEEGNLNKSMVSCRYLVQSDVEFGDTDADRSEIDENCELMRN